MCQVSRKKSAILVPMRCKRATRMYLMYDAYGHLKNSPTKSPRRCISTFIRTGT